MRKASHSHELSRRRALLRSPRAAAGCARGQYAHLSQCCSHHDFDKHAGPPELRRQARAHRRITRIDPLVPNCIVILKQAHIVKPHLRTKQPRSVRPRLLKKFVDALQYLSRLRFDAALDRVRRYTGQVDDIPVYHRLTDNRLTSVFDCDCSNPIVLNRHRNCPFA